MANLSDQLALAMQHHQAGRLQAAEQIYRQVLQIDPKQPEALHLLGLIAHQVGKHEIAIDLIQNAIRLQGNVAVFHSNLGEAYRALRRFIEASACYQRALHLEPDTAGIHNNLGLAYYDQGQLGEAAQCYRRTIQLEPTFWMAHNNLGNALQGLGQLTEAIACFRQTLQLQPDFAQAHSNLGNALKSQGLLKEAIASYQRALQLQPNYAEAYNNLGIALNEMGKVDDEIACYQRALALQPNYADAHFNLGNALIVQGRLAEAIPCYQRVLELQPQYAYAHFNLGNALNDQGRLAEAITCFQRALQIKPNHAEAHNNLATALKDQGLLPEAIASYRQALLLKPDFVDAHSNLVYTLNFCPDYDAQAIYQEHRRWNQQHVEPLAKFCRTHANEPAVGRRLRVGYVSPDFCFHVVGRNLLPLFREHDHRQFEVFCYANTRSPDLITSHFRRYADAWRDVLAFTDEQLTQRIQEDRIDILVDLTLHMAGNRLLVFARKPAPVQVTFAGYPGTTGLTTIDYRLTDPYLDPPGIDDSLYSEQSIRLPDSFWCYDPVSSAPAVNQLPAIKSGFVTFGSFNNFCKINSPTLRLWAQVLRATLPARLILLAPEGDPRRHVLNVLKQEGIDADRITFVAKQPHAQYLELYHRIDLGLDTLPYNGHSTSLDSTWMGVPVVTLAGQTVVGRAGVSQLSNMDLQELIAHSPEEMVKIVAELAGDLPRLSMLRATLRERMQASPLMDAPRFARNIEAAYRDMWQRWCEQKKKEDRSRKAE